MTTNPVSRRQHVLDGIAAAARRAGRNPSDIQLIAVSKGRSAKEIEEVIATGQRDFGESRVAEALGKWPALLSRHEGLRLHFIGRLQSNKAAEAAALFSTIHSVDRLSVVDALAKSGQSPQVYVQINIGEEPQKGGCAIADGPALVDHVRAAGLPLEGLMAIPPQGLEPAPFFALLAKLAKRQGLTGLSMGMSGDYREAVMLGATAVRVGTALFEDE